MRRSREPFGDACGEDEDGLGPAGSLERQLWSLGGAIAPGDRHRERVLDQASRSSQQIDLRRRVAQVVVAVSLVLATVSPLLRQVGDVSLPTPPTSQQTHDQAWERAESQQLSFDWALVDVFEQFRQSRRGSVSGNE